MASDAELRAQAGLTEMQRRDQRAIRVSSPVFPEAGKGETSKTRAKEENRTGGQEGVNSRWGLLSPRTWAARQRGTQEAAGSSVTLCTVTGWSRALPALPEPASVVEQRCEAREERLPGGCPPNSP